MNWDTLALQEAIDKTSETLRAKGYGVDIVEKGTEALERIKGIIPKGKSVMNGSSVTLEQVGYLDYLKSGNHGWKDLHKKVAAEKDQAKRVILRKQAALADFYLGSVHALTEEGEFLIASNTGSQLPNVVYTSDNLIFVIGTQKIVPTLADAFRRLEEYVVPLEDQHMKKLYGTGTRLSKIVVFKHESVYSTRKVRLILVKEKLGF
jgi:L-lactate utilization protein LutB